MYYAYGSETIQVLKSHDGCNWSTIEPPTDDIWLSHISLVRTPDNKLGMVWEETDPDQDKRPCCTFFLSIFDGNTWSEPAFLFDRDEYCSSLEGALMLEDKSLLVMWMESIGPGCHAVYRAYVNSDELIIDYVIEPKDRYICYTTGYSFIDNGDHIWCIFEHWSPQSPAAFYRSRSQDGKTWSPPEPFNAPIPRMHHIFLTPGGDIGIFDFTMHERNLFLHQSTDWEHWSRENLYTTKEGIRGAKIAEGKNGTLWGIIHTDSDFIFIHSSQESAQEYNEKMRIAAVLDYLSLFCVVLAVVLSLWMWKRPQQR